MTDDTRLRRLLQSALPASRDEAPVRDLWPLVVNWRMPRPSVPLWADLALGAAAVAATLLLPGGWLLIAYHF